MPEALSQARVPAACAFLCRDKGEAATGIELLIKLSELFGVTTDQLLGLAPLDDERGKPGPRSQLEARLDQLRQLPRAQQKTVIHMLDGLLAASS